MICIFINNLQIGGAQKQSVLLAKALSPTYKSYLVVLQGNIVSQGYVENIKKNNIQLVLLKGNLCQRLLQFGRFLIENEINFIFSYLASTNILGAVVGRLLGVKYIIGGIRNASIPKYKMIVQKYVHNYLLNYTIFNSFVAEKNMVEQGFSKEKCKIIANGIEVTRPAEKNREVNEIEIITITRFVPHKDVSTSIKAIAYLTNRLLKETKWQVRYSIIGYGITKDEIELEIANQNLNDVVSIINKPSNPELFFRNADIYLATSLDEGLSNSIMEAMNYSLPVVATNVGDNSELVKHNETGYLVKTKDVEGIAHYLYNLIIDPEKRKELGNNSYNLIKHKYSFEAFQSRYFELLDSLSVS